MGDLKDSNSASTFQLVASDGSASHDAAGALMEVLPLPWRLRLQGLACLAGSSRQIRHECIEFVKHNAHVLLLDALPAVKAVDIFATAAEAAAAPPAWTGEKRDPRLQPVLWLVLVAPCVATSALAAADVLQRLLHLPRVPIHQAKQLVAAGVRTSYAQLLAAAHHMVAGVEHWVQAQKRLGITSDIPAAAVAICCGRPWVSSHTAVCC
jgi:hypothetical protein